MENIDRNLNLNLIAYCGFYCGACPKHIKVECLGCKGNASHCAVGNKGCEVRACCMDKGINSCAECRVHDSFLICKIYNPLMSKPGS